VPKTREGVEIRSARRSRLPHSLSEIAHIGPENL
jgi:hypothetical protein